MADNTTLNTGSGGDTIRTLDDGTVKWPVGVVAYATTVGTPDVMTIPVAAALADNTANPTTLLSGACVLWYDGSTWDLARGDSTNGLLVNLGTNNDVTNTGTFVVQVDGTALTRLTDIETNTDSGAVVGNGVAATAQRVTLANDSTGIVSLTTSTASIGKLAANSGVDIGDVDVLSIAAGDNNIGNVDIVTVPSDPFGANADAASATGSISAKLRFIAVTGIPITGTVTVGSHAVTNAGTFVVQVDGTALTRLTDIETNTDSGAVVGNGAAATAQRVTLASDSTGIIANTESRPATATLANVSTSTASAQLLASNTSRRGAVIHNDSTAILYVKFGTTASATSYSYELAPGQHLELPTPCYTGRIDGILASGTGDARSTEMT